MSDEKVEKTFESLVLKGKIRSAVRFATMRGKGGVLAPDATDEKTGLTVLEVLKGKHPEAIIPDAEVLEEYPEVPDTHGGGSRRQALGCRGTRRG